MTNRTSIANICRNPFSYKHLCFVIPMTALALGGPGCAGRARMADDPFRRPGFESRGDSSSRNQDDPRYQTGASVKETFERANEKAREKDVSSNVSTDPLTDQLQAAREKAENSFRSASESVSESARDQLDPLMDSAKRSYDQARQKIEGMTQNFAEGSETFELYEKVRRQLDQSGAKNWRFEKDESTGESVFRVEVPHRNNPTLFRVFEAKSKDELKAMFAVAEQVQRWVVGGASP